MAKDNNKYRMFYLGQDYFLIDAENTKLIEQLMGAGFVEYMGQKFPLTLLTEMPEAKSYTMVVSGYLETGQQRLASTAGLRGNQLPRYTTREQAIDALSKSGDPMVTNDVLADLMSGKNYVRKMEGEKKPKAMYYNELTVTLTPSFVQEPNVK